jgi:hypothetical protein
MLYYYPLDRYTLSASPAPWHRRPIDILPVGMIVPPPAQALELRTVVGRGRQFTYEH